MDSRPAKRGASGIVLILLTLLGWSSVTLFLKHFTSYIDAWTANGWRYGMSALFWAPVLGWGLWRRTLPDGLWRAALVPSLFNLAAQICFALAPYYINPGLIAFLLRLQIVFIAVGAYVLFPAERPVLRSPTYVCGVVIVFTGLMGLCFLGEKLPRGATALGIALAVAAGILYSGYFLGVRYYVHHISPIVSFDDQLVHRDRRGHLDVAEGAGLRGGRMVLAVGTVWDARRVGLRGHRHFPRDVLRGDRPHRPRPVRGRHPPPAGHH